MTVHHGLVERLRNGGQDDLAGMAETLFTDALTMATRLYLESDETFAPNTVEVMGRWRPIIEAYAQKAAA